MSITRLHLVARTSSGVPDGRTRCVSIAPQNDSRVPQRRFSSARFDIRPAEVCTGLRMSTPISTKSSTRSKTSPSVWKNTRAFVRSRMKAM